MTDSNLPSWAHLDTAAPRKNGAKFTVDGAEWTVHCSPQRSNSGKSVTGWHVSYTRTADRAVVSKPGPLANRAARGDVNVHIYKTKGYAGG